MHIRLFALAACALVLACVPSATAAVDPYASLLAPPGACGTAADALSLSEQDAKRAMVCLTNYARAQSGLAPLADDALLNEAGDAKLDADLRCAAFTHTPCGAPFTDVFAAYLGGSTSYSVGENIAWGTGEFGTPRQTFDAWLNSDEHRANILTPAYRDLGIGYRPNKRFLGYSGATLWSQEFGVRAPESANAREADTA